MKSAVVDTSSLQNYGVEAASARDGREKVKQMD
jgi:hypothetical protein